MTPDLKDTGELYKVILLKKKKALKLNFKYTSE